MAPQRRLHKVKEIFLLPFHGSARSRDFSEFMDWLRKLEPRFRVFLYALEIPFVCLGLVACDLGARRFPRDERLHFDQRLDPAFGLQLVH